MNYKQLLILRLSNLTEWKNETEMIIPEDMRGYFGWADTCEFLGDGRYILRGYYECGQLHREVEYRNGKLHGMDIGWHKNGRLWWKMEYQNGESVGAIP